MALSDLQVFSEYAYDSYTETIDYQIDLFNAASRGGLVLQPAANQGDYSDRAIWARLSGLVRRRNAYGSGTVTEKVLQQLLDTSVKVAAGTPPVRIDPGMMKWIQRDPREAGVVIGRQMAGDSMADMLNTAVLCFRAAHEAQATNYLDISGYSGTELPQASLKNLNSARAKLGDAAGMLACWILHSKSVFDLFGQNISNANTLFTFGTIRIVHDGFGNPFVVTDAPSLVVTGDTPDTYRVLGLVPGAVVVGQNNDFTANTETKNGDENIISTYQAEWSYNVGVRGFAWDKPHGGHSPADAALATSTNWDKYATSHKDLGGVVMKCL